jgi:tetratricopeptide (TPR) repeat protein/transcriptional regulator with XRE-family HTH domain
MSQEELAERSAISVRTISNLERGRARWPYPGTVHRIADALKLTAAVRAEFLAAAGRRLAGNGAAPAMPAGGPVAPRQLPGMVQEFTGRRDELAALTGLLDHARAGRRSAMVIAVIGGMPGVGKTALAVHWAHQVAGRYPDGQLYVDLRGYDPFAPPMAPADALAGFLRALGVTGQDIPAGIDERAAAYRSMVAGRRFLVVLDNARSAEQVRPLLPGTPGCVTLVTSRDALGGLVAGDGAVRLEVDPLPLPDAVGLLRGLVGSRVDDDPDSAMRLASLSGRLPLALRVAAHLAVSRGDVTLAALAAQLADLRNRLDVLQTGDDERTTVRAVFTWSYQALNPAQARMFRLAGLHPGPDISAAAAASLAGISRSQARQALADLSLAHLLHEDPTGRFSCHDLLRAYAAEQAASLDTPRQRRAATRRVLDHYLHTAYAADRLLRPARRPPAMPAPPRDLLPEKLASPDEARAWFDAEREVLMAAVAHAAAAGFSRHAWQLAWTIGTFLNVRADWDALIGVQRIALAAAESLRDTHAQAFVRDQLGFAYLPRGQYQDADAHFRQALLLYRQVGDTQGQASVNLNLSLMLEWQGQHAAAVRADQRALRLYRGAGDRAGQARALNALGWHRALVGQHRQALTACQQALALQRELGDRLDEAATWDSIGYIHDRLGQREQAVTCYTEALRLLDPDKERHRQAIILTHLGDTHHNAGDSPAAARAWSSALVIFESLQLPDAQAVRVKLNRS